MLVNNYLEKGYYSSICKLLSTESTKNVTIFNKFWHAYCIDKAYNSSQAIRELKTLMNDPVAGLATTAALITIHKAQRNRDKDEIRQLAQLLTEKSKTENLTMLFAAHYFHHSNKAKQAKQCCKSLI